MRYPTRGLDNRSKKRNNRTYTALCCLALGISTTQGKADTFDLLAGPFNFLDNRQPDAAVNNLSAPTLLISTGVNLVPGSTGTSTTFAQEQAFAAQTTVIASQNGQTFTVPFVNSPALPYQFFTSVHNTALTGPWTITASNPNIGTVTFPAGQAIAPTTPVVPFITQIQTSNLSPNATLSWVQPSFVVPSGATQTTTISVNDLTTRSLIDFFNISGSATQYNLANLPTTPGGQALVAGHNYALSVDTTLFSSTTGAELSTARSYVNFAPQSTPAPFSGPVQLATSANTSSGIQYTFNFSVTGNTPYNIDPAVAVGYIYQTGTGNPNFASVTLPNIGNSSPYSLYLWNGSSFVFDTTLVPNQTFNFGGLGVNEFEILGIDPSLGLDPLNTNDFVTQLIFEGDGTFTGTMTPITIPVPGPVVGAGLPGLIGGIGLFGLWRRRRKTR